MDAMYNMRGDYEIVDVPGSNFADEVSSTRQRSRQTRKRAAFSIGGLLFLVILATQDWAGYYKFTARQDSLLQKSGDHDKTSLYALSVLKSPSRQSFLYQYQSDIPKEISDSMNFSVDPCTNFYEHVCGRWIENAEIPPDRGSVSKSWDGAESRVKARLKAIFEAKYPPGLHPPGYPDAPYTRLHDWYSSCMDMDTVSRLGASPIQPILRQVDSIKTREDLMDMLVYLMNWNIPTFFSINVAVGVRDRKRNSLFLQSAGIMLPDYTYYPIVYEGDPDDDGGDGDDGGDAAAVATAVLAAVGGTNGTNSTGNYTEDDHPEDREALRKYYVKLLTLAGYNSTVAEQSANATLEVEGLLAQWMADEPFNESETKGPKPINLTALQDAHPGIPWRRFFEQQRDACVDIKISCSSALLNGSEVILDGSPSFFSELSDALKGDDFPPTYWIPFLRSHVIYNLAPLLSQEFLDAGLEFDSFTSDIESLPPRWQKCVSAATNGLSGLSDLRFLELYFPERAQKFGEEMLYRIKAVFLQDLAEVTWMDDTTKSRALVKAQRMEINLGSQKQYNLALYPVTPDSYFNNSGWTYHCKLLHMMATLDKPVDEHRWNMRASTVNAYYDNAVNALFVPAGIMQPPFFNASYNMAQNFGGIGAIMGHEMTHGFDNTGSKFNEDRQMEEWWDKEVVKQFQAKTKCISDLYDRFRIADTQVEGNATLGENIADFGGMKLSYHAYQQWYAEENDGASPSNEDLRLFFLSYGQLWCDKERYKSLKLSIDSDVHSPNPFRTNGVVSQNADFAAEFQCPAGSPMNPVHKCVLWGDSKRSEVLAARNRQRLARHAAAVQRY